MAKRKKIIIFEDDPDIAKLIEKTIQIANFETIICLNFQEVLEVLKKEYINIACILMDVMISGRMSYDFLKEITINEVYQEIPLFAFGGKFYEKIFPFKEAPSKFFSFQKNLNSDMDLTDFLKSLKIDQEDDDDTNQNEDN